VIYWLWLQKALGSGSRALPRILAKFKNAKEVFEAGDAGRTDSGVFNERELRLMKNTTLENAKKIHNNCVRENVTVITYEDNAYPKLLKNIPDPPLVLYVKGKLPDFNSVPSICIVGPREVTDYGYKCAYSLGGRLCRGGFIVVSGGAKGSDAAAHQGALLNGGITVAVLPNGFGYDYLKQNEKLRENILEKGCLITENPPYTSVTKGAFEIRNRLMSGLSLGVVVVEAGERSGGLITARRATEQNRDLFVIPGSPGAPQYISSNRLIKDGAKPLFDLSDIFSEYEGLYGGKIDINRALAKPLAKMVKYKPEYEEKIKSDTPKTVKKEEEKEFSKKILPENLSKNAKIIYNQLDKQYFTVDELLSPDMNSKDILSALGELELFGFVSSVPGGRYIVV